MIVKLRSWWQQIKHHAFLATGILVALLVLMTFIFFAYRFGWSGTGFLNKTVWDWLQLLIVPVVLATAALLFNLATTRTEQQIALDKQRQDSLQTYLDRMSELLLEKQLRTSEPDAEVRNVAHALTVTVLPQLDARRKTSLVRFLRDSKLLRILENDTDLSGAEMGYFNFSGFDLDEANLSGAEMGNANLSGAHLARANLSGAILWWANLSGAELSRADADLSRADLSGAILSYANLSGAQVTEEQLKTAKSLKAAIMPDGKMYRNSSGVDLSHAHLSGVDLSGVDLSGADLSSAKLTDANLSGANLEGASLKDALGITNEDLEKQAKSLKGATMPDGSKHP